MTKINKQGLLLVNLGTPASTNPGDVRNFLKEFLGDPLVIQMPRVIWLPILHGMILRTRPKHSAAMYEKVWTDKGSPLLYYTKKQTQQLQELLPDVAVDFAMTYGKPSIADKIQEMRAAGVTELFALPLNPQYSMTTVEPIIRQIKQVDETVKILPIFYKHPKFIELMAASIAEKWQAGTYDKLILSYHGIPVSYVKKGDPYAEQSQAITRLVVKKLGLTPEQFEHTYQSKFGMGEWLGPATIKRMAELPKENKKRLLMISPSFVSDCLETLYELKIENKAVFMKNGGEQLDFVAPFNDSLDFTKFMAELFAENQS